MKKLSIALATLFVGVSLNAAVVATLNGKNITDAQIDADLAPVLQGQSINKLPAEQKATIIQNYIVQKLVLEDANKQKLDKKPDYNKMLENAKDQIILTLYEREIFNSIKINESKIKEAYNNNKSQFIRPARVQARHILVSDEKTAKSIINELKNLKGDALTKKFAELATSKSIDKVSAQSGGSLGWFEDGNMVKEFSNVAFSLKNGELTKNPVKTQFGYHVILKEKSEAKKQLSYDEVKGAIEQQLKNQEFQQKLGAKIQELYQKAKIEIK